MGRGKGRVLVPRKYFSGGLQIFGGQDAAQIVHRLSTIPPGTQFSGTDVIATVNMFTDHAQDAAMRGYSDDDHNIESIGVASYVWATQESTSLSKFERHKKIRKGQQHNCSEQIA